MLPPTTQESVAASMRHADAYATATGAGHDGDYPAPCRAFKLNLASCELTVKLAGDGAAVKSFYNQGVIYPCGAINILDASGNALSPGNVTLYF